MSDPIHPMDVVAVMNQCVKSVQDQIARINLDEALKYRNHHRDWSQTVLNLKSAGTWDQFKHLHPKPKPALLQKVLFDYAKEHYVWVEAGPETVTPELPEPELPSGPTGDVTEFGPPVPGWPGHYWAANSTPPAGRTAEREGVTYELVIMGELGTLFYRKIWAPTT